MLANRAIAGTPCTQQEAANRIVPAGQAPSDAVCTLETALRLWRGPAYADYAGETWAEAEIGRLSELRALARERLIATQDTVVLGRRTYDEWAGFWPGSEIQPFADFINAVTKYVATSTSLDGDWAGTHVIDGDLVGFVRGLKTQPGGDIGIHGSISVTRALLAAGVVDELRLVVAPTIVGSGLRLLDGLPAIHLETIRCTCSPSGHLLVDYRVAR